MKNLKHFFITVFTILIFLAFIGIHHKNRIELLDLDLKRSIGEKENWDKIKKLENELNTLKEENLSLKENLETLESDKNEILSSFISKHKASSSSFYTLELLNPDRKDLNSNTNFVKTFIYEHQYKDKDKKPFLLKKNNILDFVVSKDNKYIAVLYLEPNNLDSYSLEIYEHDTGEMILNFPPKNLKEKLILTGDLKSPSFSEAKLKLELRAFSFDGAYLYCHTATDIIACPPFAINTLTGETSSSIHNKEKVNKIIEKHPYLESSN